MHRQHRIEGVGLGRVRARRQLAVAAPGYAGALVRGGVLRAGGAAVASRV